jgi:hypothetical protein
MSGASLPGRGLDCLRSDFADFGEETAQAGENAISLTTAGQFARAFSSQEYFTLYWKEIGIRGVRLFTDLR